MLSFVLSTIGALIAFAINTLDTVVYYLLRYTKGLNWTVHDLREVYKNTKQFSVEVDEPYDPKTETKPRRDMEYSKELKYTPIEGVNTMKEFFQYCVKKSKNLPCLGHRPALRKFNEKRDGMDWEVIEFDTLVYESYEKINSRINNFACGLTRLTGLNSKDIFGIYEDTRKEWLMGLHACFTYNIVVMTVYASLGDDALCSAINETELSAMLVNEKNLTKLLNIITPQCPTLKYLIYNQGIAMTDAEKQKTRDAIKGLTERGIKVASFEEVEQLGEADIKSNNRIPIKEEPTLESLALIMYTSGTTAAPKGVMSM